MSASLVGSEMCIRDRSSRRREPDGPSDVAPLCPRRCAPRCARPPSEQQAVSYTHLTLPTICSV
eukprot:8490161-Alexandrium_andersonii.AAC.1